MISSISSVSRYSLQRAPLSLSTTRTVSRAGTTMPLDMQLITSTAMQHVSYHTTYCNAVNMWISGTQSTDEIQQIYYGADVPEQYQSDVLKAYIATAKESAGDVDECTGC